MKDKMRPGTAPLLGLMGAHRSNSNISGVSQSLHIYIYIYTIYINIYKFTIYFLLFLKKNHVFFLLFFNFLIFCFCCFKI